MITRVKREKKNLQDDRFYLYYEFTFAVFIKFYS